MSEPVLESRLDYALRYAALGWPVLPLHWITEKRLCSCNKACKSPGKHPMLKTGMKEASTDQGLIKQWFSKWPNANIGIATGAVSGIFALDIDPRHGGDDSLDAIRSELGAIPDDVLAITGSGGKHYLFNYPAAIGRSTTNLWPGIDTRGDGGYIVAAPSNHKSGQHYFWDAEADPLNGAILPPCPDWLLAKLVEKSKPTPNIPTTDKLLSPNEVKRLRAALGYIPADNRDQWLQVGMALHASGAGVQAFGIWCEWAAQSGKYDFADSRRVWDSFKPGKGISLSSVFGIAKQNGWSATKNVVEEIHETEGGDEILTRFVFIASINKFYDCQTGEELTRDGLDGALWHLYPDLKPSTYLLKNPKARKADSFTYMPGIIENPLKVGGAIFWNAWKPSDLFIPDFADKDGVEPWLEAARYLIPVYEEREHFLNWLAFMLQHPLIKINHAIFWGGKQRIGKDLFLMPIRFGLGLDNVSEPQAEALNDRFMDFLVSKKLAIIQEMMFRESGYTSQQAENKLKTYLASPPEYLEVNRKTLRGIKIPNLIQFIFMTNFKDALHVSQGDGRYFCIWSDAEPLDPDYYTNLVKWYDNGGNGLVVRWLMDRDVTGFEPKKPAPHTSFKSEVQATSKGTLRQKLEDLIEGYDPPFGVDVARTKDIEKELHYKFSTRAISAALSEIGCPTKKCKRGKDKLGKDKRGSLQLYAVRDFDDWVNKQAAEWIAEYGPTPVDEKLST